MYRDFASKLGATMWEDFDETPARDTTRAQITGLSTEVIDGNFPWTIVYVETDEGVTGIGEAYPSPGVHEIITDYLEPILVGEPPTDVQRLYHLMYESLSGRGSQQGIGTIAISGVELALWDLTGKLLEVPVYQLIGGKLRDTVQVYADCHAGETMVASAQEGQEQSTYKPEAYAQAARNAVDDGFDIVKFDLDVPSGRDINTMSNRLDQREIRHKRNLVEAVTSEIGSEAEIAVDLHWNFTVDTAERLCNAIEEFDLAWVEDPIPPENVEALTTLRDRTSVPLLTGENRYGQHGFRDVIENQAVPLLAPDVPKTGGLAQTKRIAEHASTYYQTMVPHNIGSPVGTVATAHLGATIPNFLAVEYHARDVPWWEDLLVSDEPLIEDGEIEVPDEPGFGIELDRDVVERHTKSR